MSDETWRVETATGAVMAMTVRAGPVGRWTCESCGRHKTQRAAVMARCLADGIDVVSIVGPGESTRAEALAVERRERAALANAMWETVVDIEKRGTACSSLLATCSDAPTQKRLYLKSSVYQHAAQLLRDDLVRVTKETP